MFFFYVFAIKIHFEINRVPCGVVVHARTYVYDVRRPDNGAVFVWVGNGTADS